MSQAPPTLDEVQRDIHQVTGFLRYLHYLADQCADVMVDDLWKFYEQHVRQGIYPTEVAEDMKMPVFDEW